MRVSLALACLSLTLLHRNWACLSLTLSHRNWVRNRWRRSRKRNSVSIPLFKHSGNVRCFAVLCCRTLCLYTIQINRSRRIKYNTQLKTFIHSSIYRYFTLWTKKKHMVALQMLENRHTDRIDKTIIKFRCDGIMLFTVLEGEHTINCLEKNTHIFSIICLLIAIDNLMWIIVWILHARCSRRHCHYRCRRNLPSAKKFF